MESQDKNKIIKELQKDMTEENLWEAVIAFQNQPFFTATGLPFTYEVKKGRRGDYTRELVVSRRKESKTLTWSSLKHAFKGAVDLRGSIVIRPKALGDIRGVSYIYPLFYKFGIIEVTEKIAALMNSVQVSDSASKNN